MEDKITFPEDEILVCSLCGETKMPHYLYECAHRIKKQLDEANNKIKLLEEELEILKINK